ncbi:MAG: two-component system, NarL family, nitrate/nitrite response regulator NarL [Nocardioidaceae bacterium]|jgi:DNA-binding CsgD family transcriptional regulator|nr:two-component system, NarL family, nitrate/nitrite response regulator NarL [Nocardioidaceae bacterium]
MPDLVLTEREQTALRSLYACSPVPGRPMPTIEVFDLVNSLVPGDVIGAVLADDRGHVLDEVVHTRRSYDDSHLEDMSGETGPLYLGLVHWSRHPAAAAACHALPYGLADGFSLGFRNGVGCVSQLFMDREKKMFSERDMAMIRLITPALQRLLRERPTPNLPATLTVQERRVLLEVAAGLSNADIAVDLCIAPSTVRKHLENSFRKLGVGSRLAAVAAIQGTNLPEQDLRERIERLA